MMKGCIKCNAEFPDFTMLNEHNRDMHNNAPFECPICGRTIQMAQNMDRHIQSCESKKQAQCSICKKKFESTEHLSKHMKSVHVHGVLKKCTVCSERFQTFSELEEHIYTQHANTAKGDLPKPDHVSFENSDAQIDDSLRKLYKRFWSAIRTFYKFDPLVNTYNFRVNQYDGNVLSNLIEMVYLHQQTIFKLNIGVGLILQHRPTGIFRYYHVGQNNQLLTEPRRIASRQDLHTLLKDLKEIDLHEHGALSRPDTTHIMYSIANITIKTANCAETVPIGGVSDPEMVQTLKNNHHILLLDKNKSGELYKDNLCFFRCLSSELTKMNYPSEKHVRQLVDKWLNQQETAGKTVNRDFRKFSGVKLLDLTELEDCFNCNINVYTLESPGAARKVSRMGAPVARMIFRSTRLYEQYLYLNYYQGHFSRITNINHYAGAWICSECGNIIETRRLYGLHIRKCQGKVRNVYPGGGFSLPRTVFDELSDEGFQVTDHYYPYYIVYDFESILETFEDKSGEDKKLSFEKKLVPVSVSVCSNIPGFQAAHCIISSEPEDLINKFVEYIATVAETAYNMVNEKFIHVTEFIAEQVDRELEQRKRKSSDNLDSTGDLTNCEQSVHHAMKPLHKWETTQEAWESWLRKVPVVGFNSSRFDMNLVRRHLIPILIKRIGDINSCITRGSAYVTLSTDSFIFLDICNFLAAGISYSKWLKGFGVEESKGHFPYEWLSSFDKLYETKLPKREEFHSTLKEKGISEVDYQSLQDVWNKNQFQTMFDFLQWYNNLDVKPFITALEKMRQIFMSMNIDLLKEGCVSLPGLAMTHMFKTLRPDYIFQLFDNSTKHYHQLVQQNIVGGPSIIFNRYTSVGTGKIKKVGPVPQSIEGYDCNGLYLNALKQNMPTGFAAIWELMEVQNKMGEKDCGITIPTMPGWDRAQIGKAISVNMGQTFYKRQTGSGFDEILFVCYTFQCLQESTHQNLSIHHKWNGGQKIFYVKGSQLPVDGWIPELGIILQYNGCYFHGHQCNLTKCCNVDELNQRQRHSQKIQHLLEFTGNQIISINECEFQHQKKVEHKLAEYLKALRLKSTHGPKLTMAQIIELVAREEFFGMLELDIQVPFWRPELREKMKEFPPIFKNALVSITDIGRTMARYATENDLMKKPRRCLISSYYGTKILLPSPLVKWYLENGLVVTRIYRAIEYTPIKTFEHLVDEVTSHRTAADKDVSYQAYGETFKLLGNSYYGKCLTNIERHRKVQFGNRQKAAKAVNSCRFRALEPIASGLYEIHSAKSVNCFKLPINIGYFVYGYSKLRMLQFYYDFLTRVLPFNHFELLEMDTDSLYFSLSSTSLETTVAVDQRYLYETLEKEFLVTDETSKRVTGLFKLEWFGKAMMCTAPKSYICFTTGGVDTSEVQTSTKLSTKGVSKTINQIGSSDFETALFAREMIDGINKGFRMKDGDLFQYSQRRRALSFLYIKRAVEEDGIHTTPLDL